MAENVVRGIRRMTYSTFTSVSVINSSPTHDYVVGYPICFKFRPLGRLSDMF